MLDVLIIVCAKYLIALPVLALLWYFFFVAGRQKKRLVWLVAISLPLAYLIGLGLGQLFNNPRPFVVGNFTPLIAHAANNGFPSDHMLFAATIAMLVLYFNRRLGTLLWIVAIVIGFSRVLAGVHHTIDIAASAVVAVVSVTIGHYILYYLHRRQ